MYSPYDQIMSRSLIFINRHLKYKVGINEYQDQVTTDSQYKRYLFDFDAAYRDRNLFFVFDSEKGEFMGSDPDYHFIANDRFTRYGKRVPEVKSFLLDFHTKWKLDNKTVIVNKNVWDRASPKERNKIGLIQLNTERVGVNNKIRMYTAIKTYRGGDSITKYATHVRRMKISNKYLQKLRTRYRKFDLTEFDEWHFGQSIRTQIGWSKDDSHHYRYYNWRQYEWGIFKSKDRAYNKWFSSSYDIFNAIGINHY